MKRTTPMRRTAYMKRVSDKRRALMAKRREVVAWFLAAHPVCQRCGERKSHDVHEVLRRSAGGSILDVSNCRALCRRCHDWVHANPEQARVDGWLKSRY